jgi:hypothetical protein
MLYSLAPNGTVVHNCQRLPQAALESNPSHQNHNDNTPEQRPQSCAAHSPRNCCLSMCSVPKGTHLMMQSWSTTPGKLDVGLWFRCLSDGY